MWASTGASNGLFLYKNGVLVSPGGYVNPTFSSTPSVGETLVSLNGGDYIDVRPNTSITGANDTQFNISIERLSGPSAIAATETVAASYENTAGPVINNTSPVITYSNKKYDTHGAMSGANYIVPVSGKYLVISRVRTSATAFGGNSNLTTIVEKNTVAVAYPAEDRMMAAATIARNINGSQIIDCLAGDQLRIRIYSDDASTLSGAPLCNLITYIRVGN
jgi:hypothetical protein